MKIYAIRDRMLDYFTTPFCAPGDKDVLAAMAQRLNVQLPGEHGDAIKQAPHHFEIWILGEVQEDGHITPELGFLADCSSLIRGGIREADQSGGDQAPNTALRAPGTPTGAPGNTGTPGPANGRPSFTAPGPAQRAYPDAGGGNPGPGR